MANWQNKIKIKDMLENYEAGGVTLVQVAEHIIKQLDSITCPDEDDEYDKENLMEEFRFIDRDSTIEDVDYILNDLYDWGDTELENCYPRKKLCWIG